HNFRTPRLDLDSVYGLGPDAQPHLYKHDARGFTGELVVGSFNGFPALELDLPRSREGHALIGDPRNDENAIVAQIHLAFLKVHNLLVRTARGMAETSPDPEEQKNAAQPSVLFERARNTLRWLYQWLVWHDFVRRLTD